MKPWAYGVIAVVLIAAAGVTAYFGLTIPTATNNSNTGATHSLVTAAGPRAFGSFDSFKLAPLFQTTDALKNESTSAGSGAGGSSTQTAEPATIKYLYAGTFTIPDLPVFRRATTVASSTFANQLASGIPQWLNPSSFNNLRPNTVVMNEAGDTGYQITIDYLTGTMSLYKQNAATMNKEERAVSLNTNSNQKLPSETALIATAKKFLTDHGITTNGYGAPEVAYPGYMTAAEKVSATTSYTPFVSIVFPWLLPELNGVPVVDQSGLAYGLTVTIDTAANTVNSVSNISDLHFTSSHYDLVSDKTTIIKYVEQGGVYGGAMGANAKTVTIPLETPQTVYLISRYQLNNDNNDYLVPALKFPIGTVPAGTTVYQDSIIIPLVPELLNAMAPIPVPASDTAVSSGTTSGSTGAAAR